MTNASFPKRSGRRGSAMVELAITVAVFIVPVFLYSEYIAEALWAGLKAQEAAGAAAWSFSGYLLHDYQSYNHTTKYSAAAIKVRGEIDQLYKGLDPWAAASSSSYSASDLVGMSTKSQLMAGAVCDPAPSGTSSKVQDPSDPTQFPIVGSLLQTGDEGNKLHTGGLISCQAQVQVTNWLFGTSTGQQQVPLPVAPSAGGGSTNLWPSNILGSIQLCGIGAASHGSGGATCNNSGQAFTMYTDDWGLSEDETEDSNEGVSGKGDDQTNYQDYNSMLNSHFANLGQAVYQDAFVVPYNPTVQAAIAQDSDVACTAAYAEVVGNTALLDKQYAGPAGPPQGNYNLAYRTAVTYSGSTPTDLSRDDNSTVDPTQYEGSITQDSYTWPVRHFKVGPMKQDAYRQMEDKRTQKYLAQ